VAISLGTFVDALGGQLLQASRSLEITRLAPLESADANCLSFLNNPKYQSQLATSQAGCVIVSPALQAVALARAASGGACIVTDEPYLYFARASQLFKARLPAFEGPRIHPSAVIDDQAQVHETARIGPLCVIERGAQVGAGSVLKSRVTLGQACVVGERCIIHSGVVIGADGFGFAPRPSTDAAGRGWEKIEQLAAVRIGNDVEIGANSCIDRGALDDTVIEDGVKLDNLVQIGHNVRIGAHTAMAGCAGVAGSATIGAHCTVGGGAVVLGHLTLADGVNISAASVVTRSILKSGHYSGLFPIDDNAAWEKNAATLKRLHSLRERIQRLESSQQERSESKKPT
jgi:UDP-3-O-[3-hydroxymyristoyl] glucosamine N-acyltransferase